MDHRLGHQSYRALRPGYRVLLIEDNAVFVGAVEQSLRMLGHEVKASLTGTDLARLMHLLEPEVVVTDLVMPEFDAIDSVSEIHRLCPSAKIIAISGNLHLLALAAKRGVTHALAKPFDGITLDRLIRTAMRRKRRHTR